MAVEALVSPEEYLAIPYDGINREYDEGRVIEMSFASVSHGTLQGKVFFAIYGFVERTGMPLTVSLATGFWVGDNVERGPDVCVIRNETLAKMTAYRGSRRGAPDLAIEVVSPAEKASELRRKIRQCLAGGASAVWALYEEDKLVIVERPDGTMTQFGPGQFLEAPELLPGLRISIDWLFSGLTGS